MKKPAEQKEKVIITPRPPKDAAPACPGAVTPPDTASTDETPTEDKAEGQVASEEE